MATYCVRAGGTAANKAAAVGPSSIAANCMSIVTHNTQTFAADDIIIISDAGGTHTDQRLIPPSSGTEGHPIIYQAEGTPVIAVATSQELDINAKNYITVQGVTFSGGTYANAYLQGETTGISLINNTFTGGVRNVVVTNAPSFLMQGNSITQGANNLGLYFIAGSGTITGNVFHGIAGQTATSAIRFDSGANGVTWSNNTITGWSLNAATDRLVYFNGCSNVTSSGNTIGSQSTPNSGNGYYVTNVTNFSTTDDLIQYQPYGAYFSAVTGFVATRSTVMNSNATSSSHGWDLNATVGTMTDTNAISNSGLGYRIAGASNIVGLRAIATSNGTAAGGDGFWTQDGAVFTGTHCIASDNFKDGFSANNTSTMTLWYPVSFGNGVRDANDNTGNGFTGHQTATCNMYFPIAYGNTKSGIGFINGTTGLVVNGTFINNYRANAFTHYGELYLNSTGAWSIRNTIAAGPGNVVFTQSNATGTYVFDYNLYHPTGASNAYVWRSGDNLLFGSWQTASSADAHSSETDPLLSPAYRPIPTSPAIGAGVAIAGIHDQATPATDADGKIVHFLPPSIGAYDSQGNTKTVTSNFSPTGYSVRGTATEPAVIALGSDGLVVDLSGLDVDEKIQVKSGKKQVLGFVGKSAKHQLKGSGGATKHRFGIF